MSSSSIFRIFFKKKCRDTVNVYCYDYVYTFHVLKRVAKAPYYMNVRGALMPTKRGGVALNRARALIRMNTVDIYIYRHLLTI